MAREVKVLPVDKEFLSSKEAKAYLGCSDDYLKELRDSNAIAYSQRGKMIWYPLRTLKNLVLNNMVVTEKECKGY